MKPVIAVFDIGKTNKKFLLFDEKYKVVHQESISIPEIVDEDGFPCEDLDTLVEWVDEKWAEGLKNRNFKIKALNFTTYGASLVFLDASGKRLGCMYNYLKPFPPELQTEFEKKYGDLSLETASPRLGMLNSGMQLYWLKNIKPEIFEATKYAMHFPNFLAYHFSGKAVSDLTSIGCHTILWDFEKEFYHPWVRKEGAAYKLPPIAKSALLDSRSDSISMGCGLHDSSAALNPYLSSFDQPFTLVSTGTWCVNLNPFSSTHLSSMELERDGLCYLQFNRNLIKASRFFLGKEHDSQVSRIVEFFDCEEQFYMSLKLNQQIVEKVLENGKTLVPNQMKGTGPYPDLDGDWELQGFDTAEDAYHQLMLDLVCIEKTSLDLIKAGNQDLFVEGGFAGSDLFVGFLASFYPDQDVYRSSIAQASALGAAMQMHDYWNWDDLKKEALVKMEKVKPVLNSELLSGYYKKSW